MSKSIVKLLHKNKLKTNINPNNEINHINHINHIDHINHINHNNHNIPKLLHLCYKNKYIPENIIPTWKNLNPEYEVIFYDDIDCINFLNINYNQLYVDIFNFIKDGPIKADFFRICVLYKSGGIYCDIDIEPLISFSNFIEPNISFLTCLSASNRQLNPHIIMCNKNHKLLKLCIDTYIDYYKNKFEYTYWGWSIVHIMKRCIRPIFKNLCINDCVITDNDNNRYQFLKEVGDWNNLKSFYCKYNGKKILNNRYNNYNAESHHFQ